MQIFKFLLIVAITDQTKCQGFFYSSYTPSPLCTAASSTRFPTSTDDVVAAVREGIANELKLKSFGGKHSQTDIICTNFNGIPLDMSLFKSFNMNQDGITATFGPGVQLNEATAFLRKNGRGLRTTPAFGNLTLGGGIGTGAHGSSLKFTPSLSSQVVGLEIVDGFGNIQTISDPDELLAFRIHLGLLGIITSITFKTVPLYKFKATNTIHDEVVLTNGAVQQWAQELDTLSVYWFPSVQQVILANWTIVDVSVPGNAFTNDHVPPTYENFNAVGVTAFERLSQLTQHPCRAVKELGYTLISTFERYLQQSLLTFTPDLAPIYSEDGITVKNPAVGFYDVMISPTCQDQPGSGGPFGFRCFWAQGSVSLTILDNELSLPMERFPEIIEDVKDILSKAPAYFPMLGIIMRFEGSSDEYMSTAFGRDTVNFEFYVLNRKNMYQDSSPFLAAYQTIMQKLADKYDGRSHWGKSGPIYHTTEKILKKLDPIARQKFIDVMNKYDPNEIFINNFGKRLKDTTTVQDLDPRDNVHCAIRDNCICSKNSDCASYQKCTSLPGYSSYKVCQTFGESPQILPVPPIAPLGSVVQWLSGTLGNLDALVAALLTSVPCTIGQVLQIIG